MKTETKRLESTIMELEATNQVNRLECLYCFIVFHSMIIHLYDGSLKMLKDELQALQLAYNSLEMKYGRVQEDNRELVGDNMLSIKYLLKFLIHFLQEEHLH